VFVGLLLAALQEELDDLIKVLKDAAANVKQ